MHYCSDTAPKEESSLPIFLDQKDSFQRVCVNIMVQIRVVHPPGGQHVLGDQKSIRHEQL